MRLLRSEWFPSKSKAWFRFHLINKNHNLSSKKSFFLFRKRPGIIFQFSKFQRYFIKTNPIIFSINYQNYLSLITVIWHYRKNTSFISRKKRKKRIFAKNHKHIWLRTIDTHFNCSKKLIRYFWLNLTTDILFNVL